MLKDVTSSPDVDRIRAREADILGHEPRVPPMEPAEYSPEAVTMTNELRVAFGLPPNVPPPEYIATVLRHPALFRHHNALAVHLVANGALGQRDRELAVLRLAWLAQAPYEWGEHVGIAKRMGGITDAEIEQVLIGSTAPEWNERDRTILRVVEELLSTVMLTEETWAMVARHLDVKQQLELPILIGQYLGVAFLQNSLRLRLENGNEGLSAR